jgi:flagellar hook-associated protein 3 FlgL
MRISTNQIYSQSLNAMLDQQSGLNHTQLQVSTGRRILTPADDPIQAAHTLDLSQALETNKQFQLNADTASYQSRLEESTLGGVTDLLQRVRELAVQGANATQTNETRRYIAAEVRGRLDELLAQANTRDANGEYLFAGYQGQTQPFARSGTGFSYSGDQNKRYLEIGPGIQVVARDSGADVFQTIRNGNGVFTTLDNPANTGTGIIDPGSASNTFVSDTYTITFTQVLPTDPITYAVTGAVSGVVVPAGTAYTDGAEITFNGVTTFIKGIPANGDSFTLSPSTNQDIFTTLQNLVNTLEAGVGDPASQTRFSNGMNRVLTDIDQDMGGILEIRGQLGGRLNTIDSQKDANDAFSANLEQTLSGVQDLDYAEASSRLNRQLLGLQAAQQAFVKVQGLSLFNFLR